jgi:transcriptional regulator with XRE-family HTH domain
VGGVERGERNVSIVNVEKLAKALDVDIENIFSRIREEYDENTNY